MTDVISNHLKKVYYDAEQGTLTIEFSDGSAYAYFDVPEEVHTALLTSPSKSSYFRENIKGNYEYSRV